VLVGWKNSIDTAVVTAGVKLLLGSLVIALCIAGCLASVTFADPLKSSHYQFQETTLGGIGTTDTHSTSYQTAGTGGILGLGSSADADFQIEAGGTTTADPALAFAVTNGNVSFSNFSPSTPTTATSSFQVSNYTSYGYVVQIFGSPPSSIGGHTLAAMASAATSQTGIEQFGINLVANTSPVSFGANPDPGQFGVGNAEPNYATTGSYRYVSGDLIAYAPKSSGVATYTISYLINVSSLTPGGKYSGGQTIICTGTY